MSVAAASAIPEGAAGPEGVRGWLALLCFVLTIGLPIGLLSDIVVRVSAGPQDWWYDGNLASLMLNHAVASIFVAALSIASGVALLKRKPIAVPMTKFLLLAHVVNAGLAGPVPFHRAFGLPADVEVGLEALLPLVVVAVYALIWYLYLVNSKRVRATFRLGHITGETRARLAAAKDLSFLYDVPHAGLAAWVAVGYLAASVFAVRVAPAAYFFLNPRVIGSSGSAAELTFAASAAAGIIVGLVPVALLFAVICTRPLSAWQRVIAWGATIAAAGAARSVLASKMLSALPGSVQEELFPLTSPALAGTADAFVNGALLMIGILVAIRLLGVTALSLALGVIAADFLHLAATGGPFELFPWLVIGIVGALYGVFICAGFFMQSVQSSVAAAERSAAISAARMAAQASRVEHAPVNEETSSEEGAAADAHTIAARIQAGDGTEHFCRVIADCSFPELEALCAEFPIRSNPQEWADTDKSLQAAVFVARILSRYEVFTDDFEFLDAHLDAEPLSRKLVATIIESAEPHAGAFAASPMADFYELATDLMIPPAERHEEAIRLLEISAPGYKNDHMFWLLAAKHNLASRNEDRELAADAIKLAEQLLAEGRVDESKVAGINTMLENLNELRDACKPDTPAGRHAASFKVVRATVHDRDLLFAKHSDQGEQVLHVQPHVEAAGVVVMKGEAGLACHTLNELEGSWTLIVIDDWYGVLRNDPLWERVTKVVE